MEADSSSMEMAMFGAPCDNEILEPILDVIGRQPVLPRFYMAKCFSSPFDIS
jgi:hypothetical protein